MAVKIAVACEKGGVGKTSVAVCLSAVLHEKGYKVLLVDCDMQADSTDFCGCQFEGVNTLYDCVFGGVSVMEAIQKSNSGFAVLAGDPLLRECEARLSADVTLLGVLRQRLEAVDDEFDFIIVDTAPGLGNWLISCLLACDSILVPVTCDRFSLMGLSEMSATVQKVKNSFGRDIDVLGLVVCRFNARLKLSKGIIQSLEKAAANMHTVVFNSKIREGSAIREAQAVRIPVNKYAPRSGVAVDFERFTDDFLEVVKNGKNEK